MRTSVLFVLASAALLSSCANVPSDYRFDASKAEGLVVGSITYDGSLGLYALILTAPPGVDAPRIQVGSSMWPALTPQFDEGLKATGGTFAVALPAGDYKIQAWDVRQGQRSRSSSAPIDIAFSVERGRATYLGNLHFSKQLVVSLRDRSSRDMAVLQTRYEALKSAPLTLSIDKDMDLQGLGGSYRQSYQIPVYIPTPMPVRR